MSPITRERAYPRFKRARPNYSGATAAISSSSFSRSSEIDDELRFVCATLERGERSAVSSLALTCLGGKKKSSLFEVSRKVELLDDSPARGKKDDVLSRPPRIM